jgi:hypothetical protein
MRRRNQWTLAHEAERLSQLMYDIESAGGRYMTVCLEAAAAVPAEFRQEWEQAAADGEQFKNEMVNRCQTLFNLCCNESQAVSRETPRTDTQAS